MVDFDRCGTLEVFFSMEGSSISYLIHSRSVYKYPEVLFFLRICAHAARDNTELMASLNMPSFFIMIITSTITTIAVGFALHVTSKRGRRLCYVVGLYARCIIKETERWH